MKNLSIWVVVLTLISCHAIVKKEDVKKINGYWEIKQVGSPGGGKKEYKVNETIDYFELKDNQGFRQKVMPQFDGKFKTNDIRETIKILEKNNAFFIEYSTKYNTWQEEIITIEDSALVLKNQGNLEYTYKKFKPFSFK
ncbi:lipocalin family protein [Flavobacterium sp.]|uniref:lipocalin family protein n=1 Tax=Flavobacterium sp. TaxID=239 RepID=UPI0025D722C9|nr:lipocalin family protein [Flavobacterium sp.]